MRLTADLPPPVPNFTFRPLPPLSWCSSGSDTAPTPRAERTSDSHDSVDKTPEESPLPCSVARPTGLFGFVWLLGTLPRGRPPDAQPRLPPSIQARPMPFAMRWRGHPHTPGSQIGR